MQLTRFDRWLREKYVYETHIQTLRIPESLPKGIRAIDQPDVPGKRYKHLYVTKSSRAADALISQLKADSQMYTTEIVDTDAWYVPFIAPKDKSLTWWLFSAFCLTVLGFFALIYIKGLIENPEFRKNFEDVLRLIKN